MTCKNSHFIFVFQTDPFSPNQLVKDSILQNISIELGIFHKNSHLNPHIIISIYNFKEYFYFLTYISAHRSIMSTKISFIYVPCIVCSITQFVINNYILHLGISNIYIRKILLRYYFNMLWVIFNTTILLQIMFERKTT